MSRPRMGGRVATLLTLIGAAVVLLLVVNLAGIDLPDLNPFSSEEQHHDQGSVLLDLRDVSEYKAASGSFQVLVDVEQDAKYLPDFLKGERITFIAEGEVDAVVDFSTIDDGAVQLSDDGKTATITLPTPRLTEPRIDPDKTRVMNRDRGLVDRIQDFLGSQPTDDQPLYQEAAAKLSDAAEQSALRERARANTRQMLSGLLRDAGIEKVIVRYEEPAERGDS